MVRQLLILLKKPEFVANTISQSTGIIPETIVINSFKQIEKVWDELFPAEQARIINLLVREVKFNENGLEIKIFKDGLSSLSTEMT